MNGERIHIYLFMSRFPSLLMLFFLFVFLSFKYRENGTEFQAISTLCKCRKMLKMLNNHRILQFCRNFLLFSMALTQNSMWVEKLIINC